MEDPDDEVVPALPKSCKTRPGDFWVQVEHRIGCEDSREQAFPDLVIVDGTKIGAAFRDPP